MNKEKKIFLTVIVGSLRRGGAEMQLLEILPRLDKKKYTIEVFLLTTRGPLADLLEKKNITVTNPAYDTKGSQIAFPARIYRLFIISFQLFTFLLKKRPDIVHFFLPQSYCFAMPITIITAVKVKVMSRLSMNNYRLERRWMWQLEKILHKFTNNIVVNSEKIKQQLISEENVPQNKLTKIYSGVAVENTNVSSKVELRKQMRLDKDILILIMVANLIPYKGHLDIIKSLGLISNKMPEGWQILFIGRDDGIKAELIQESEKQGIKEHCQFMHPKGDVSDYYTISDIGILTSHEEGFSIAILEAMRSKLPMLVTNVGGNAEAVIDNKTGFVVPARDCDSISKKLLKLSLDADLRQSMGAAAYSRLNENFSIDICVKKHDELYCSLV